MIKFNERMKRGRIDKEIKDSAFRRGEELIRSPHKYEEKRTKSENKFTSGNRNLGSTTNEVNNKYQNYLNQIKTSNTNSINTINSSNNGSKSN